MNDDQADRLIETLQAILVELHGARKQITSDLEKYVIWLTKVSR